MTRLARLCAWLCILAIPVLIFAKMWRVEVFAAHGIALSPSTSFAAKFPAGRPVGPVNWGDFYRDDALVEVGNHSPWYRNIDAWKKERSVPEATHDGKMVPAGPPIDFASLSPAQRVAYGLLDRLDDISFWNVVAAAIVAGAFLLNAKSTMTAWLGSSSRWRLTAISVCVVWLLFGGASLWQHSSRHGPVYGAYWTSGFDSTIRLTQWVDESIFQFVSLCAGIVVGIFVTLVFRRRLAATDAATKAVISLMNAFSLAMSFVVSLVVLNGILWALGLAPAKRESMTVIGASMPVFAIGGLIIAAGWTRLWKHVEFSTFGIPFLEIPVKFPYFTSKPSSPRSGPASATPVRTT